MALQQWPAGSRMPGRTGCCAAHAAAPRQRPLESRGLPRREEPAAFGAGRDEPYAQALADAVGLLSLHEWDPESGDGGAPGRHVQKFVVCDLNGFHEVDLTFCGCLQPDGSTTPHWVQLFRMGWFPSSTKKPSTAFRSVRTQLPECPLSETSCAL